MDPAMGTSDPVRRRPDPAQVGGGGRERWEGERGVSCAEQAAAATRTIAGGGGGRAGERGAAASGACEETLRIGFGQMEWLLSVVLI